MAVAAVGVRQRQRSRVTAMMQWVLPLALAPTRSDHQLGFVGHCAGTTNVNSRAPACPLLYGTVREAVHCLKTGRRPRSECVMEIFHHREITFLT
jgi:hypothetical protein